MMITAPPAEYISPELVDAIRKTAMEAEQLQQLHPAQLDIIYVQKWFKLFVPKKYGGLELDLLQALQLEEALAWTDGSVGWTVTLCSGAGWFIGFLDPGIVPAIFDNEKVCLAGSGKATGIARKINDGYQVTGSWDYATGANAATAFTANCLIEENGELVKDRAGNPLICSFLFLPGEVMVRKNWKRIGMIATASNSFEISNLAVNKNRSFIIDQSKAVLKEPLYQYPFLQFAETTLAVNSSGMAIRFLELSKELIREKTLIKIMQDDAVQQLEAVRNEFYHKVTESWNVFNTHQQVGETMLKGISSISKQLAFTSRRVVDELYPYCGMVAANPETEINRVWRNLHTASQHSLFTR